MQVLIVDDEPLALDILESYIQKMPGLQIVSKCRNALEAFAVLSKHHVDLLLLDINMPEISGIDFIKTLKDPPLVVFTTAYSQFAVESYELNALDYLVKPISFERFLKAINKSNDILQSASLKSENIVTTTSGHTGDNIMFVKTEGKLVKIDLSHLWLIEGLKDYVKLWTDTGRVVVHTTMKNIEDQLAGLPQFIRVNKSYIINMQYISEVDGNVIRLKDQVVTIGNTYRDDVHRLFDKHKLL